MSENYVSEIFMFAGNFAPRNSGFCSGQLMAIASNNALFSLIGTIYGGDGRTTMQLPDLQGRVPVGEGTGLGLSPARLGQKAGQERITLTPAQMPQHQHNVTVKVAEGPPDAPDPHNHYFADQHSQAFASKTADNTTFTWNTSGATGGNQGHNNMQPYLAINYCMTLFGTFPSRN